MQTMNSIKCYSRFPPKENNNKKNLFAYNTDHRQKQTCSLNSLCELILSTVWVRTVIKKTAETKLAQMLVDFFCVMKPWNDLKWWLKVNSERLLFWRALPDVFT